MKPDQRVLAQITLDRFPRNFPLANVTGKSPTSYGLATDYSRACRQQVTGKVQTFEPSGVRMMY